MFTAGGALGLSIGGAGGLLASSLAVTTAGAAVAATTAPLWVVSGCFLGGAIVGKEGKKIEREKVMLSFCYH